MGGGKCRSGGGNPNGGIEAWGWEEGGVGRADAA